ncbi:MAG TPA: MOSC domain-containing protein [Candidatus Stackebrandtia faecavium]|nr:MOSC domain-containing protein [Candidatus Stackebrandtia faecavium]
MRLLSVNTLQPNEPNATVGPFRVPEPRAVEIPSSHVPGPSFFEFPSDDDGSSPIVSAYARLDYDYWQTRLGRPMPNGMFGEHLTTHDLDLSHARIGERWRIGPDLIVEVTGPRVPSGRFRDWLRDNDWLEMFMAAERPGVFVRVVEPGRVEAGDTIVVQSRPDHDVTVWAALHALSDGTEKLPSLLRTPSLPQQTVRLLRQYAPDEAAGPMVSM